MKRIISILLAIATLLTLTACGKKDSGKVQASSKGETTTQSPAKETKSEEAEPIEDYLVKVELTPENFFDYFEWECVHCLDDWGDMTNLLYVSLKSKAYDDGLIMYDCPDDDVKFEYKNPDGRAYTDEVYDYFYGRYYAGLCLELNGSKDDGFNKEEKTCIYGNIHPISYYEISRVKGTITYVKAEYIDHIEKEVVDKRHGYDMLKEKIYLKNGEVLERTYLEGFMY